MRTSILTLKTGSREAIALTSVKASKGTGERGREKTFSLMPWFLLWVTLNQTDTLTWRGFLTSFIPIFDMAKF